MSTLADAQSVQPAASSTFEPGLSFGPVLRFKAFDDFSVGLELRGTTVYGERVVTTLAAGPNPEGQLASAGLRYEQPFFDLSFGEDATLSLVARSSFAQSYPLQLEPDPPGSALETRTFTERLNELEVGLAQPFGEIEVGVEGRIVGAEAVLERRDAPEGLEPGEGRELLPSDSLSAVVEVSALYEGVAENTPAPPSGGAASVGVGYGLGLSDASLSWVQVQVGGRGYLALGDLLGVQKTDEGTPSVVLASRMNAGANVGRAPAWRRFAPVLRGYDAFDLVGARYIDLSLDLRYYTGLDAALGGPSYLRGVTPYGFVDAGNAWGDEGASYRTPDIGEGIQVGFGAGLQLDLETQYFRLPLNLWYARGTRGKVGFALEYPY